MASTIDPIDIFVLGMDDFNRSKLEVVDMGRDVNFHPLLDMDAVTSSRDYDIHAVLDAAEEQLHSHPRPVAGIIGYWDFPVSLMVPILAKRLGLSAPSVQAVVGCEHKYWSRILQKRVAPNHVPAFQSLDPFDEQELNVIQVSYPFWIKPVKSYSSHLGFRVRNSQDLALAIKEIRSKITCMGNAFNNFLNYLELPEEILHIGGNHCLVEGLIRGRQCTLEGFVQNQKIQVYGVVDSFRYPNGSSFLRYQYPSSLPRRVVQDMIRIARDVFLEIGLDHCAFNMEFFWDKQEDRIWILEINPRISQSHGDIFEKVDGTPHHRILLDLALKQKPVWSPGQGRFACAAKVFLRRFQDARVSRAPSLEEVQSLEAKFPGAVISILATQGMRLSQLEPTEQDSYSYAYAILFVGASSFRALRESIRRIRQDLRFEFEQLVGSRVECSRLQDCRTTKREDSALKI